MTTLHWVLIGLLVCWLYFGIRGTVKLYVGYGFVMIAQDAKIQGRSQDLVIKVDYLIAVYYTLLDALLNVLFYTVVCLDPRAATTWNLLTGRLCIYNAPDYGKDAWPGFRWWFAYHKWWADLFAAFLDGKDIRGDYDHVKGSNRKFGWLGKSGPAETS